MSKCNPNHCPTVKEMGRTIIILEKKLESSRLQNVADNIDELKEQNRQMIEALISAYKGDIDEPSGLKWVIESVTGKNIDEVLK